MTMSRCRALMGAAILGGLAACAVTPEPDPPRAPAPEPAAAAAPAASAPLVRNRARWQPADWSELPGWDADTTRELWPALQRGCEKPAPGWEGVCAAARGFTPAGDAEARAWLRQRVRPYRVESLDGNAEGLATGYFEPLVAARREARAPYRVPLHALPDDLAARKPWWTRRQIDSLPAAQAALRGRELAFVADPLDALLLQVQGSGRLLLTEANGSKRQVRVAYAGHNDQPYKSVGRWLIEQGELKPGEASWPAIKAWARANPKRLNELLWSNPRYVFFKEEALPDPNVGPKGAQAVPLTPGRSIAVDPQSIPYGTPVWLDTTEPLSATPLRRLVMAQDTGSAITGAVRADYFWGWGEDAEAQAGRMKQPLRMWVLWPR
ncbi:murein transglycosylase A [Piscinibacter sp.]|uniref:murein transglycosylase A n=1 Tax=Piscinibacter sp. TaxID=1903157 RepID=UPI0039E5B788